MRKETNVLIALLFISPILAELVSGASHPIRFFNPIGFLFIVTLYGCGAILIRELKTRWKLQWSVIFLGIAYAFIEEGITTKDMFNPLSTRTTGLGGYGEILGFQSIFALTVIIFHTTFSILIPIAIVDLLWPKLKDKPLLDKKQLYMVGGGIVLAIIFGAVFFGTNVSGKEIPYYPHFLLTIGTVFIIGILIWFAYKFRKSNLISKKNILPSYVFGIAGFFFQAIFFIPPYEFSKAQTHPIVPALVLFCIGFFGILFAFRQIYNVNTTKHHISSLIFGSVLFWILLKIVFELSGVSGSVTVGIITFALLFYWRKKVLNPVDKD